MNAARRDLDPEAAARFLSDRESTLGRIVGPPTRREGDESADYLAPGTIRQAAVELVLTNYRPRISATQMGKLGLLVREQHQTD